MSSIVLATFYRFTPVSGRPALREAWRTCCLEHEIKGTINLAPEGINGTVAGRAAGVANLVGLIRREPGLETLEPKESAASFVPFDRLKVRLKRELVPLGIPGVDPTRAPGTFVEPCDWNAWISRDDVTLIDIRNDYETELGSFPGAIRPPAGDFRQIAAWARARFQADRPAKIATYCTGGIRCEKLTAYLRTLGLDEVYQLRGGILGYLEQVSSTDSRWQGQCFVFDQRETLPAP